MTLTPCPLPLPAVESRTEWLSARCCLQHDGEMRIVVIGGVPLLHFAVGDRVHARLAAALIAESRAARVKAVQKAFALDDATLWRARQRLRAGGAAALLPAKRGPRGPWKVGRAMERRIVALRAGGFSPQRIADRLGISAFSVRRILQRQAQVPTPSSAEQMSLAATDAQRQAEEPAGGTLPSGPAAPGDPSGVTPMDVARPRTPELAWLQAMVGLARDGEAAVVFESRSALPWAGVLLAMPALAATGLLETARATYGRLRQAIYGLRATLLVLNYYPSNSRTPITIFLRAGT